MSMKIASTATHKLKSTVMFVASFALVLSSVSVAVPVFLTQTALAVPATTNSTNGFSNFAWGADRRLPSGSWGISGDSLSMTVDGNKTNSERFEGVKADLPTGTTKVSADLYVDPEWKTQEVIAGIWGQASNEAYAGTSDYNAWPTLEFNNVDNATASVDVWDTMSNGNIEGVTMVPYGSTIQLEIAIDPVAGTFTYYLNGKSIFTSSNQGYGPLTNVIFNNYNNNVAGDGYTTVWSNFQSGKQDTLAPTITNTKVTNPALWGDNYNILNIENHLSATGFPTIGGAVKVSADFNDDTLLTNAEALIPGRDFFFKEASWGGIPSGTRTVDWNTKSASDWSKVPDGDYTFMFTAMDAGNAQHLSRNSSELPIRVTVDNTPPEVTFVGATPAENSTVRGTVKVEGNFTDANGLMNTDIGVHAIAWYCHTDWEATGVKSCNIDTTKLANGPQQLTMNGRDKAGNTLQVFRTIVVDNEGPAVSLTGPINNAIANGASLTQSWFSTDTDVDHYVYESYNNEAKTSLRWSEDMRTATSKTATNVKDAIFWWRVKAVDYVGNESWSELRKLTIDNIAPKLIVDAFTVTTNQPTINGTLDDLTANLTVIIGDTPLAVTRMATAWTAPVTTPLADGTYTVLVTATDLAGNKTTNEQTLIIVTPVAPAPVVATLAAAVAPAPLAQNLVAFVATPAAADDTAVLGASTTKQDAPAVAGAETSKDVAAEPTAKNGFNSAWYWLLTIPVAGAAWWALAAFRRRES